jgi:hypothetical protein
VIYASVHSDLDYNRFAKLGKCFNLSTKEPFTKLRNSIVVRVGIFLFAGLTGLLFFGIARYPAAAQQLATATPETGTVGPSSGAFVTVTYIEPINVRSGPGSFDYPVIGSLPVGGTAVALGRSPHGEWIQIVFPDGPRGTGWVYAANVTLSTGALLPVVEPPPTPAPVETATLNPTYVAQLQILPTSTRLPTFTAPPPLAIPTYTNPISPSSGKAIMTWFIAGMALIGVLGLIVSAFRRR